MSDEAQTAALPGRPEYTVKKYIQLVEALRDKAAALTSSSGHSQKGNCSGVPVFHCCYQAVWLDQLDLLLVHVQGYLLCVHSSL